ncbi:restriction endonuclease subunit S [Ichthyobacterium seriolicida]|uniref:Restriction modification system DNA specificity domain-containing protein n=1 Tax=Ichthyobacterium seriolicida TaxID=242600 RepID=A0A1J1EAP9_9FLAO|nr:restriction endonuclease subunit S [Ichthyobacterium seriolicida]BAV94592.1 restriction modification system DNA specificity domain-containing protein [Ichthyobacterium seriolicida]
MELTKTKYKQTEVGLIPEDWNYTSIESYIDLLTGFPFPSTKYSSDGIRLLRGTNIKRGETDWNKNILTYWNENISSYSQFQMQEGDLVIAMDGSLVGRSYAQLKKKDIPALLLQRVGRIRSEKLSVDLLKHFIGSNWFIKYADSVKTVTAIPHISPKDIREFKIPLPPTITEQKAIATALSDVDDLISNMDKLISKKKAIKQGAMQQLLTPPHKGGKRLARFTGEWQFLTIEAVADCLDNLRVPLNGEQRGKMNGDIPYCGANGVVDYVNDFVIDDDIILMAEDGGYFDEYKTRPIAYRMKGKCWVNNHAHILKAKNEIDQGFLYFSLVHKNILDYINGGTRAKLNKGEMNKIECWFPKSKIEQETISGILSDIDTNIEQLETKKAKYKDIKQGMMQELLTGKTRLV